MPKRKPAPDANTVLARLRTKYPTARYELDWGTPLDLLVATILAAQCTDARVNQVTKSLFKKYTTAQAYLDADVADLEEAVHPTGTFRRKAKAIRDVCKALVQNHGGEVPKSIDDLVALPGVARKTANVVLNTAFDIPSGVIVDTHVLRVSRRLGLTAEQKPEKIERDLMRAVPEDQWTYFGPAMVLHGRYTCTAASPDCESCVMKDVCPRIGVDS